MSQTIRHTDNTKPHIIVASGTLDTSTPLAFPGNNYPNYGPIISENLLHLLENFANSQAPAQPVEGQLYYRSADLGDTSSPDYVDSKVLKYFDGDDTDGHWKSIASLVVQHEEPAASGEKEGHLWLDNVTGKLSIYHNGSWVLIPTRMGNTYYINRVRVDTVGTSHPTLEMVVNGVVVAIVSSSNEWIPNSSDTPQYVDPENTNSGLLIDTFPRVTPGTTLNNNSGYFFAGTATSSQYADLAERYHADAVMQYGTVVDLGGEKEITTTTNDKSTNVFGVISTRPGLMLNSNAGNDVTHPYVALAGRVPCRVHGIVKKGSRLVSSAIPGHARAVQSDEQVSYEMIIGRALESNNIDGAGIIEIVVGAK